MDRIALYNSRVRDLMSQEYRRVSQERQEYMKRQIELAKLMFNPSCTHIEYTQYEDERKNNEKELIRLGIELNVWDQAREICFNAADEVGK